LYATPGTLRNVTADVSVATMLTRTMNQPTSRPPTKYAFKSFWRRVNHAPMRVMARTYTPTMARSGGESWAAGMGALGTGGV
jgi:hypothetical protein